jgi:hypothetical protein
MGQVTGGEWIGPAVRGRKVVWVGKLIMHVSEVYILCSTWIGRHGISVHATQMQVQHAMPHDDRQTREVAPRG